MVTFTTREKKILLDLVNSVPVQGNRQSILKVLEELNALARKVEQLPVEEHKEAGSDEKKQKKK